MIGNRFATQELHVLTISKQVLVIPRKFSLLIETKSGVIKSKKFPCKKRMWLTLRDRGQKKSKLFKLNLTY